jgi:mannose-6-phosphate isomerase
MAIALTEFSGFCGFRPLDQIKNFLETVPEFKAVVGDQPAEAFIKAVSSTSSSNAVERNATSIKEASSLSEDVSKLQKVLKDVFAAVMKSSESTYKSQLQTLVQRYQKETGVQKAKDAKAGSIEELVLRLNEQFPDDIGVFCSFLLNVVNLKPGQACFLQANEPHAYLQGSELPSLAFHVR